jgi:hypothetical protein
MSQVLRLVAMAFLSLLVPCVHATAEHYPDRIVRVINPYPPGALATSSRSFASTGPGVFAGATRPYQEDARNVAFGGRADAVFYE